MVATLPFGYTQVVNAPGSFPVISDGGIQGVMHDDPAVRWALMAGWLSADETLPMFGGVGIYEDIPQVSASLPAAELGCEVGRAIAISGGSKPLSGFCVFNQNHSAVISAQSPVPLVGSGMTLNYLRLGSGARIEVAIDPVLVSLEGGLVSQQVSWDFVNQRLIPYQAAYNANVITGASWASTNGGEITYTTTSAHGLGVGVVIHISGFTPDGYNGTFTTKTGTTGSTIVVAKTPDPGSDTVQGQLDAGGGALPCKINRIRVGNSMVVELDPDTNFADWNRSGSTAVIQI